jgi:hypothetical protein
MISIALKRGKSGSQNIPLPHKSYLNSATPQGSCHSLLLIHAQLVRWRQENIAVQAAYKDKKSFVLP